MELTLRQKGPVAPPPVLEHPFQRVAATVVSWDGVIGATHWHLHNRDVVDGADFYFGDRELGHIHLNGEVHLATDKALRDTFVGDGAAEPFPFGGSYAVWTLFRMRVEADTDPAIRMFRCNYERLIAL